MRILENIIRFGKLNATEDKLMEVETNGAGRAALKFRESDQTWILVNPNSSEQPIQFAVISTNRVWVSKSGDDANAQLNREDKPFLSFQAAINAIKSQGDGEWDIIGRPGTYDEALEMTSSTSSIIYNLRLDDGCNLFYKGPSNQAVIGGSPNQLGEVAIVNIYGKGAIRNQAGTGGNAVGEPNFFINGFLVVNIYSAKEIISPNYALAGFVGEVQNVRLFGAVNAINLTTGAALFGNLKIKNAQIDANEDAIKVIGIAEVDVRDSVIDSTNGKGITCERVNKLRVEGSEITSELEAIESKDQYQVCAIQNKLLLSRSSDVIKIGDEINRNDVNQSKIHFNYILCEDTSKAMVKAGTGQNVKATVTFNISNVGFESGSRPGQIESYGTNHNTIHPNITL